MYRNEQPVSVGSYIAMLLVIISAISLEQGMVNDPKWYLMLWITIPLLVVFAYFTSRNSDR